MADLSVTSINYLKDRGYYSEKVEYKMRHAYNTKDFLGFIDVLGFNPKVVGVLGVQSTSRTNTSHRIAKIMDRTMDKAGYSNWDKAVRWLKSQNQIHVHGWGGTNGARFVEFYLEDDELKYRDYKYE